MTNATPRSYFWGAAGFAAALVILSLFFDEGYMPGQWLNAWTDWLVKYVALVVSAIKVWQIGDAAAHRILHGAATPPAEKEND